MLRHATLALAFPSIALAQYQVHSHLGTLDDAALGTVSAADDVDGDGVPDYIIGAYDHAERGRARVISGATGVAIHTYTGNRYDDLGLAHCGLGDVDGDGRGDFAISAIGYDGAAQNTGRVTVYSGVDGSVVRTHEGVQPSAGFGSDVARAGDVDADGVDDLIVSAYCETSTGNCSGVVRVFSGATGAMLHQFDGPGSAAFWGTAVAGAGDVDGDGHADIIAGSYSIDRIRVYSGRTGAILHDIVGGPSADRLGEDVIGLGDVDGDGFGDFAASAPNGGSGLPFPFGLVRVFSGATGATLYDVDGVLNGLDDYGRNLAVAGDWNGDGVTDFAASGCDRIEIRSGADGALLRTVLDDYPRGIALSNTLACPGDLDGDGSIETLVGDIRWDDNSNGLSDAGRVLVVSGSEVVGTEFCTSPNFGYRTRPLVAQGSAQIAAGDLRLSVTGLVANSNGFFVTSNGNGVLVNPGGSWGVLCIHDPGGMGRHFDSLGASDAAGLFQFRVDLTAIPTPTGIASVLPGETRYWQLWHRDQNGQTAGSNFSSAVAITFQ